MPWTAEQVLDLAPDAASAQAGRGLAVAGKWVSLGSDEDCVWGEAKGSSAKPYQTCIDLSEPAFKCSCPSRKFPCKHGLGLFLLFAEDACPSGQRPDWAQEWLAKRAERSVPKEPKAAKEADAEAQAKRAAKREDRVGSGVADCDRWLKDLVRSGFAAAANSSRSFETLAARLVDAQAPGLARMVRRMGDTAGSGAAWQERLLERAGALHLLLRAYSRLDSFPEELRAEVRQAIGWNLKKEELSSEEQVVDLWSVYGQTTWTEDRITVRRSWLFGADSRRWASVLSFSVAGAPFEPHLVPGMSVACPLAYYPGAYPLRALLVEPANAKLAPMPGVTIDECLDEYSRALSFNPWLDAIPFALAGVQLALDDGKWWAVQDVKALPLTPTFAPWRQLAFTGGEPAKLFGEWNGRELLPLACEAAGRWTRL